MNPRVHASIRQLGGVALWLLASCALLGMAAHAHETLPASLVMQERNADYFDLVWRVPATQGDAPDLSPALPPNCVDQTPRERIPAPAARMLGWQVHCAGGLRTLPGQQLRIEGLQGTLIDTVVQITFRDGHVLSRVVDARTGSAKLSEAPVPDGPAVLGATGYFRLGVAHILGGFDHLLFVLCLVLLVPDPRRLILTITGFTLAHSVTLGLASLGVVTVPTPPIEACIALSIAFVAAELVRQAPARTTRRRPWLAAGGFGLLHGLGFAGALSAVGLPADGIPRALLLFNLGVEAGQLAFVAAVLLTVRVCARLSVPLPRRFAAYGIGTAAGFWLAQRLAVVVGLDLA